MASMVGKEFVTYVNLYTIIGIGNAYIY
jgi:hypothetical protein